MATVVTNSGRSIITNRIKGAGSEPNYLAWGTGAGTAAVGDVALFTESAQEARVAGTSSQQTTNVTNDTYQVTGTIVCATSTKTITNAGLFDAPSSGNLFHHGDFTGILLNPNDSILLTMKAVLA